jgi:prepilin-type N-terminal cleavage/methylation domain-containing protein
MTINHLQSWRGVNLRRTESGLTLIEFSVCVAIAGMILAAVVAANITIARAMAATANYNDMNKTSRNSLDLLSADVRNAAYVTNYSSRGLTLVNTFSNVTTIVYAWDGSNLVTRTENGGRARQLLSSCFYFNFNYYLRVPQPGLTFLPTTNVLSTNSVKLISVSWICNRSILGTPLNTESVQTANIVIRN